MIINYSDLFNIVFLINFKWGFRIDTGKVLDYLAGYIVNSQYTYLRKLNINVRYGPVTSELLKTINNYRKTERESFKKDDILCVCV